MNLSKRIDAITDLCPALPVWSDIGTDHGFTAAWLLKKNRAGRVIAADISEDSLAKARLLCREMQLEDTMLLRTGDGLEPISDGSANGAVISGMGAPLIISILEAQKQTALSLDYIVLSPNNYPERMRKYLSENGFRILSERIIEERTKFYPVMLVCSGKEEEYTEGELYGGRHTVKDADYALYLQHKLEMWHKIERDTGGKNAHASHLLKIYFSLTQRP